MMDKIKITQEQANIIESLEEIQKPFYVSWKAKGILYTGVLEDLPLDELIRALYIGYEVEEEFKFGDWVRLNNGDLFKITSGNLASEYSKSNAIRHATPEEIAEEKQRRWWKNNNRNVWELKKGDVVSENFSSETQIIGADICRFSYPDQFKVVCFVKDRKDV